MSDMTELYQEIILDHNKNPRNYGNLKDATIIKEGFNSLCGDHLFLYLKIENNLIVDISFKGEGCAISVASASMMSESVKGKTVEDAIIVFTKFHEMLTKEKSDKSLDKLLIFEGVKAFPSRIKCATLIWQTLLSALKDEDGVAKTE